MKQALTELILRCAREVDDGRVHVMPAARGEDTPLYGGQGRLDSLQLVTLVIGVEDAVEAEFGVSLTLADERALSQRRSPFRTVGSFADYIAELLPASA